MSTTEIYSEVLDIGREKMNEGDYLKLANFLCELHKKAESAPKISHERILSATDTVVEFDTPKGKHYLIKINQIRRVVYEGSNPDDDFISGSVNGESFTNMLDNDFGTKWGRFIGFYGIKNIKRSFGGDVEEFTHWGRFKRHCDIRNVSEEAGDSGEEEEMGEVMLRQSYYIRVLFGINSESLA